ncbi:MAG: hypothetical protein PHS14_06640 [Elusimicrobia bacterium]|nr:hypothetical protein [Elusimicrobiota bacterium]
MKPTFLICLFLSGSGAAAQVPALRSTQVAASSAAVKSESAIGVYVWAAEANGYFKLRWQQKLSRGRGGTITAAGIAPSRGEVWVASDSPIGGEMEMSALDGRGKVQKSFPLPGKLEDFRVLDRGRKDPSLIVWNELMRTGDLRAVDASGKEMWRLPASPYNPESVDVVPETAGGPLVVLGHMYGPLGLRALDLAGKRAWEQKEVESAYNVRVQRQGTRSIITANNHVGRIYLMDLKGHVFDRVDADDGNMDRTLFGGSGSLMFGLASGLNTGHEIYGLYKKKDDKSSWERVASADLGRVTITSYALGDFDGDGNQREVVGTENGWVLVLDQSGKVLSEARFPGKIQFLGTMDPGHAGKDELILCVSGRNGGVYSFSRP